MAKEILKEKERFVGTPEEYEFVGTEDQVEIVETPKVTNENRRDNQSTSCQSN